MYGSRFITLLFPWYAYSLYTSLYTRCRNYIRITIYHDCSFIYTFCFFNFIIVYPYFLDTPWLSLYTGCTGNYAWIMIIRIHFVFQFYNRTLLFPWYAYNKYEFIYRVYWKLCADRDLSFIYTLLYFMFQFYNSTLLFPWYAYNKLHEFIYRVC